MKNVIIFFQIILLSVQINAQTVYPSGVPGCIARWTFDTTDVSFLTSLPDMSGNNNHGITYNIASTNGFRNKPNSAGGFNGNSSWAEVMHNAMLSPTALSIISLIRLKSFNSSLCESNQIISKGYPHFIIGNYGQCLSDNPYDGACGIYSPNYTQLLSQVGTTMLSVPAGNYVSLDKWYLFSTVIDSNSIIHYQIEMDTSIKAATLLPINTIYGVFNIGTNNQNISIGKHLNPLYPYWVNGEMDELIIFNRALSSSEIYSLYNYLWGWSTDLNEIESKNPKFLINVIDGKINIETLCNNYSLKIYNILGQKLFEKNRCFVNESIKFQGMSTQLLIISITDNHKKIYTNKLFFEK